MKKQHKRICPICEKRIEWPHGSKPEICPYCNAIRWDKPIDECKLFNLQEEYIKEKDQRILGKMYDLCLVYGMKTARKMLQGVHLSDFEDRVQDAVTYFISYYLRYEDYYVTDSFGYQILKALQQQLYRQKQKDKDEKETSYDNPIDEEGKTFIDFLADTEDDEGIFTNEILNSSNRDYILEEVSNFLEYTYISIVENRGLENAILCLLLLLGYLKKKKDSYFESFYKCYGYGVREIFETQKLLLLEFLQDLKEEGK